MTLRLTELVAALDDVRVALFDTNACIYYLNEKEPWLTLVRVILERADRGLLRVVVPSIVQIELLVHSFKVGDELERRKTDFLLAGTHFLKVVPLLPSIISTSAEIRGRFGTGLADSIVIGSAYHAAADVVVGNDRAFRLLSRAHELNLQTAQDASTPRYLHMDDFVDQPLRG